jgi:hypothetical protein
VVGMECDAFLVRYGTGLCEQYGKIMKEYVEVPDSLLRNVDELAQHFRTSYAYVSSLKPKSTTRRTKTSGAQTPSISAYAEARRSGSCRGEPSRTARSATTRRAPRASAREAR